MFLPFLVCLFSTSACVFDHLVLAGDEGFSYGPSRHGALYEPEQMPTSGAGFVMPPRWKERGLHYGTPEMVYMLVNVGRALMLEEDEMILSIADLSRKQGGRSPWHRSHQTGRDVDLLFFMKDENGKRVLSQEMRKMDRAGQELGFAKAKAKNQEKKKYRFDVIGNWKLVALLLDNPIAEVQYIFIQNDLRLLLLEYAVQAGVPDELIERATMIMRQPGDSAPHHDHFHVRIYCSKVGLRFGCQDFGQMRWHKKDYKYERRTERLDRYDNDVAALAESVSTLPWLFR